MYSSPAEYVLRRPDDAPDSVVFFVFVYRHKTYNVHVSTCTMYRVCEACVQYVVHVHM